jgi:hypothetical protein
MRPILISGEHCGFDFRDPKRVRWSSGTGRSREDECVHSMEYFVNDETIARRFGHSLDPLLADWIDVALACYLADRLAQRRPLKTTWNGRYWSRTFNINIPVRRPESWNSQVCASLSSLLAYGLRWATSQGRRKEETTQRTCGFLFLTLGACSALAAASKELFLYENGIGGINLPYDGTQLGTYNARATHPSTCTSCILRRMALESAGLARYDDSGYLNDLSSSTFVGRAKQLDALRVMNWQVQRMSLALLQADPWQALVSDFIELQKLELDLCRNGKLLPADLRKRLLHLYSQYTSEWKAFSARRHCDLQKRIA